MTVLHEFGPAAALKPHVGVGVRRQVRPRTIEIGVRLGFDVGVLGVVALAGGSGAHALYALGVLITLVGTRAYAPKLVLRALNSLREIVLATVLAAVPILVVVGPDSLGWQTVGAAAAGLLVVRAVVYLALRQARASGRLRERAVIVGGGMIAQRLHDVLTEKSEYGLEPIGFADDAEDQLPGKRLGRVEEFARIVTQEDVREVIVSFGVTPDREIVPLLREAASLGLDVRVVPRLFDVGMGARHLDGETIWDVPVVRLRRHPGAGLSFKRLFDVVVSGLAVIVASPVLLGVALAVRVTSPGPILFRQERVGLGGRRFQLLKFRSMRVNDDSDTEWKVKDADKLTPIGTFLRRTSLDELPQLYNVLRGDMSLIGPRPERPYFVDKYSSDVDHYADRHRLPVGLTGWAQVHGLRGDTSITDRAKFDNYYIDNWSPFLDLKVLAYTAGEAVRYAVSSHETRK